MEELKKELQEALKERKRLGISPLRNFIKLGHVDGKIKVIEKKIASIETRETLQGGENG